MSQPYTQDDLDAVTWALNNAHGGSHYDETEVWARYVLDALAAAGRLATHAPDAMVDVIKPDGTHHYWSTHCRHGNHNACSADAMLGDVTYESGMAGSRLNFGKQVAIRRNPAQCKTCAEPCICPCHARTEGSDRG